MTQKNSGYIVIRAGTIGVSDKTATVETVSVENKWGYEEYNAAIGAHTGTVVYVDILTQFIPNSVKASHNISSVDMWIDDEGRLSETAVVNEYASLLVDQLIFGDVVLLTSDHEGESHQMKDDVLANVHRILQNMMKNTTPATLRAAVAHIVKRDNEWEDKHGLCTLSVIPPSVSEPEGGKDVL